MTAALQRTVDEDGRSLFLLKGETMLQYRLSGMSRTTQDIDGLVRTDLDEFLGKLDATLTESWGPLTMTRGEAQEIRVPTRIVNPRRFDIKVAIKGVTWRRVQVEISLDEGNAGIRTEEIPSPSLAGFGLPTPERLVSLSMAYQIAQKIHASTDPHDPPHEVNDRARDVVDLLLLRDLATRTGHPALEEIHNAVTDIFAARAVEAQAMGMPPRTWPVALVAHRHWLESYADAAKSAEVAIDLEHAVAELNEWLLSLH
ncbi:nucleotidyl transferase AbiEii/AbiGii toxin family protein [Glutamicibacter sp. JC586]|uniref:nucleotidyl transferase AbiEii/AbiGii toxin family protein n=1 Tax=Glutamicibacter sp. JC586 TaxID=2590552 RepID=UPI00135834E3|nr:nucleotidyl transferase AbiEii/AbiGii toxin family protein [Glutamicibacter sp. JC586]